MVSRNELTIYIFIENRVWCKIIQYADDNKFGTARWNVEAIIWQKSFLIKKNFREIFLCGIF